MKFIQSKYKSVSLTCFQQIQKEKCQMLPVVNAADVFQPKPDSNQNS